MLAASARHAGKQICEGTIGTHSTALGLQHTKPTPCRVETAEISVPRAVDNHEYYLIVDGAHEQNAEHGAAKVQLLLKMSDVVPLPPRLLILPPHLLLLLPHFLQPLHLFLLPPLLLLPQPLPLSSLPLVS
ncbi:hypothetical protein RB195_006489 [Necator americanus]|uniref:Uncharacterized protein n=1 Tax=Necator americanus TaxID=51031 RepID=A0ABR1BVT2_NECAM